MVSGLPQGIRCQEKTPRYDDTICVAVCVCVCVYSCPNQDHRCHAMCRRVSSQARPTPLFGEALGPARSLSLKGLLPNSCYRGGARRDQFFHIDSCRWQSSMYLVVNGLGSAQNMEMSFPPFGDDPTLVVVGLFGGS